MPMDLVELVCRLILLWSVIFMALSTSADWQTSKPAMRYYCCRKSVLLHCVQHMELVVSVDRTGIAQFYLPISN